MSLTSRSLGIVTAEAEPRSDRTVMNFMIARRRRVVPRASGRDVDCETYVYVYAAGGGVEAAAMQVQRCQLESGGKAKKIGLQLR